MKNYLKFAAIVILVAANSCWIGYRHGYLRGQRDFGRDVLRELTARKPETNITELTLPAWAVEREE